MFVPAHYLRLSIIVDGGLADGDHADGGHPDFGDADGRDADPRHANGSRPDGPSILIRRRGHASTDALKGTCGSPHAVFPAPFRAPIIDFCTVRGPAGSGGARFTIGAAGEFRRLLI